jgi:hypothetical protein
MLAWRKATTLNFDKSMVFTSHRSHKTPRAFARALMVTDELADAVHHN